MTCANLLQLLTVFVVGGAIGFICGWAFGYVSRKFSESESRDA